MQEAAKFYLARLLQLSSVFARFSALGAAGRCFESSCPDQKLQLAQTVIRAYASIDRSCLTKIACSVPIWAKIAGPPFLAGRLSWRLPVITAKIPWRGAFFWRPRTSGT